MDDGKGVNRHADSGRKTVVDRDSLRDAIRGTASSGVPQAVKIHNSVLSVYRGAICILESASISSSEKFNGIQLPSKHFQ